MFFLFVSFRYENMFMYIDRDLGFQVGSPGEHAPWHRFTLSYFVNDDVNTQFWTL